MAGCFRCFGSSDKESSIDGTVRQSRGAEKLKSNTGSDENKETPVLVGGASAKVFTFQELASATNNFAPENLLGEGGFGKVFKGQLKSTGQVVAVKQLDWRSHQGNREFLVEVLMLSHLEHPNLVNLVGYCAQENHRLVVYEFMPLGSLEGHLHDITPDREPLDWNTRMKIAAGAAAGLEYLHKSHPPVIHRDMKASNILLDEGHNPKLSDFGLAKLGPVGDETHVSTQVMGTYGYCAPEYAMTGQLTLRSDVYSYGVVLLELISGRKAFDNTLAQGEQSLVAWARPLFRNRSQFRRMADPLLQGHYPQRSLYQSLAVAAMCLQEDSSIRPTMKDIVSALAYLASQPYDPNAVPTEAPRLNPSTTNQSSPGGRPDNQDEVRFGGQHTSQSPNRDSPNITEGDAARYGTEGGRGEPAGGLGRNSNVGELDGQAPQRNSPARPRNDSTEGDTAGGPGRNSNVGELDGQAPQRNSPARPRNDSTEGDTAGGPGRNSNVGELDGQAPQRNSPARPRNDSTEGDTAGGPGRNSNGDELDGQAPQRNSPARPRNEGGTDSTDGNV